MDTNTSKARHTILDHEQTEPVRLALDLDALVRGIILPRGTARHRSTMIAGALRALTKIAQATTTSSAAERRRLLDHARQSVATVSIVIVALNHVGLLEPDTFERARVLVRRLDATLLAKIGEWSEPARAVQPKASDGASRPRRVSNVPGRHERADGPAAHPADDTAKNTSEGLAVHAPSPV